MSPFAKATKWINTEPYFIISVSAANISLSKPASV